MEEIKLDVQLRKLTGTRKIKSIRREDFIPGIVYGESKEPTSIKIDRRAYERIKNQHRGQSVLFHINVMEGEKKLRDYAAIIKEEQHHPVHSSLVHLDFQRISMDKEIVVKVPIETKGIPVGVAKEGGSVDQPLRELSVVCLPANIPQKIVVDIAHLKIHDAIHVKDLVLPDKVRTKQDPAGIVVSVVPPMKEKIEAPAEVVEGEVAVEEAGKEAKPGEAVKDEKKDAKGDAAAKAPGAKPGKQPEKPEGK